MRENVYKHFFNALRKGQVSRVKHYILNEGVNPNCQFSDGSYPQHISAENGDSEMLQFLLSIKASPDIKNRHGQTPLMVGMEHESVVETLLSYGCKVNSTDNQWRTALHLAAGKGLLAVVKKLVEAKASINATDHWGRTPMQVALLNTSHGEQDEAYFSIIQILLQKGSYVNRSDRHRATPLFLAVNTGHVDLVQLVISFGAHVDKVGRHKMAPLMLSIMKGFTNISSVLLQQNCRVNIINPITRKTCLQVAVEKGQLEVAQAIVASGCQLHLERWIHSGFKLTSVKNQELADWLQSITTSPQTLKELTRGVMRRLLGVNLMSDLKKLSYPAILKDYILLKDIL